MENYGKAHHTHSDTIKAILGLRLDMYVQTLKHIKGREVPRLSKKVLKQIEDSINQGMRTIEEIGDWTVPIEMTTTEASTFGIPPYTDSLGMNCEEYAVVEVGRLCETVWRISCLIIFDGKISCLSSNRVQPYGTPFCNSTCYTQSPGSVPPYTSPQTAYRPRW